MKTTKGFTLIELLITATIVGVLSLSAMHIFTGSTEAARASEAKAAMGAMKDRARTVYQRTGVVPTTYAALGMATGDVRGTYYASTNYVMSGTSGSWKITCAGVFTSAPTAEIMTASLVTGVSSFNR